MHPTVLHLPLSSPLAEAHPHVPAAGVNTTAHGNRCLMLLPNAAQQVTVSPLLVYYLNCSRHEHHGARHRSAVSQLLLRQHAAEVRVAGAPTRSCHCRRGAALLTPGDAQTRGLSLRRRPTCPRTNGIAHCIITRHAGRQACALLHPPSLSAACCPLVLVMLSLSLTYTVPYS